MNYYHITIILFLFFAVKNENTYAIASRELDGTEKAHRFRENDRNSCACVHSTLLFCGEGN